VAVLILRGAISVTTDAAHILMEGTPEDLDTEAMTEDLIANIPSVTDIHHVHAWSLASGRTLVTLHAVPAPGASPAAALTAVKERLAEGYGVTHATVQIELEECPDQGEKLEKLAGNPRADTKGVCS
jgi:cobalt-zinc-cadmium efflux system protein